MAFGYGAHGCVGQQLARMEIDVAVQAVLRRYDVLENTNTSLDWADRRLLRGPKQVDVRWSRSKERDA